MKKFMICLFVVAALAIPGMASAWDDNFTAMVDVKGYGDQTASYSNGAININSNTYTNSTGSSQDWTGFSNAVGNTGCPGPNCGMGITQGNITNENYTSTNTTIVTGKNLMGSADMSTLGGLAACTTPAYNFCGSIPFGGNLFQTQTVNNSVSGPVDCGVNASSTYTGTQTLNLNVGHLP